MKYLLIIILSMGFVSSIDLDQDGIRDEFDNCLNVYNPNQIDYNKDGYGNLCDGDFNKNGAVDLADVSQILSISKKDNTNLIYDINLDGIVGMDDVMIVLDWAKIQYMPKSGLNCAGDYCPSELDNYTIIIIPDTQYMVKRNPHIFNEMTQWIVDNKEELNIKYVIHEGDLVQNGDRIEQWNDANESLSLLDGVVNYTIALGDHDGLITGERLLEHYYNFIPPQRFPQLQGTHNGTVENSWYSFNAGAKRIGVLSLEFLPRTELKEWINQTLDNNQIDEWLIVTHSYTYIDGTREQCGGSLNICFHPIALNFNIMTGEDLWEENFKHFSNIKMIFSGHLGTWWGGHRQEAVGVNENIVHEMLANYQNDAYNGGDGYMRIIQTNPRDNLIEVKTYSPYLDSYIEDLHNKFTLEVATKR